MTHSDIPLASPAGTPAESLAESLAETLAETLAAPADRLDAALARLAAALGQLESAVAVRLEDDLSTSELDEELAIMQDDRARLALELDDALARVCALEKARDEVLRRLDAAEAGVRAALDVAVGVRDEE